MKISFIGTGLMGFPMAKNLLKKNLDLKIFSRTLEKSKPLEEFGGKLTNSLSEAIIGSDIIFTMLTDDDAVEKVLGNTEFLNKTKNSVNEILTIHGLENEKLETAEDLYNFIQTYNHTPIQTSNHRTIQHYKLIII